MLKAVGLDWLFWIIVPSLIVLQDAAIFYIWRPFTIGYRAAQGAVLLGLVETVGVAIIGFEKPAILKQAFITSRTERGLPVRQEVLDMMDNPAAQFLPVILTTILACIWLFLLAKLKPANAIE